MGCNFVPGLHFRGLINSHAPALSDNGRPKHSTKKVSA